MIVASYQWFYLCLFIPPSTVISGSGWQSSQLWSWYILWTYFDLQLTKLVTAAVMLQNPNINSSLFCLPQHNQLSHFSHCNARCTVWWSSAGSTTLRSGHVSPAWETKLKLSCRTRERTLMADKEPRCTSQLNSCLRASV